MKLKRNSLMCGGFQRPCVVEAMEARRLLSAAMLTDVTLGGLSANPQQFIAAGDRFYFLANDEAGRELWVSRGDAASTHRVVDLQPGPASGPYVDFAADGDDLLFTTYSYNLQHTLWRTDGTAEGTRKLIDLPGTSDLFHVGDVTLFLVPTSLSGPNGIEYRTEIWRTDGTPDGTFVVKGLSYTRSDDAPQNFTVVGDRLFFTAVDRLGRELWVCDGTRDGTFRVADLTPGAGGTQFDRLVDVAGTLYFATNGIAWKSDGTAAGAMRLGEGETPPTALFSSDVSVWIGARRFYTTGGELIVDNGDFTVTRLLSVDQTPQPGRPQPYVGYLQVVGDKVLFVADVGDGVGGELWSTDGTPAGTRRLSDINPGAGDAFERWDHLNFVFNGFAYFTAYDPALGLELWRSDGTKQGTTLVSDLFPWQRGIHPQLLTAVGDDVLFAADGSNGVASELWKTDADGHSTLLRRGEDKWLSPTESNARSASAGGKAYFYSNRSQFGTALWVSDGTPLGTRPLADPALPANAFGVLSFVSFKNELFFVKLDFRSGGVSLWKTDGTDGGAVELKPSSVLYGTELAVVGDVLYFTCGDNVYGTDLWKTDGTPAGTTQVKHVAAGAGRSPIHEMTAYHGELYFFSVDPTQGTQFWRSNGTEAGTFTYLTFKGSAQYPAQPVSDAMVSGKNLYFAYNYANLGQELWLTEHQSGTKLVRDIAAPGAATPKGSFPEQLTDLDGTLYFVAQSADDAPRLWKTNGTVGDTVQIGGVSPVRQNSYPIGGGMVSFGGLIFFLAQVDPYHTELYRSDGTAAGTRSVRAGLSIDAQSFTVAGDNLYFSGSDGLHGSQLWKIAPPTASAGSGYSVEADGAVTLDATASADIDPTAALTFAWDLDGDGQFGETGAAATRGDETGPRPTFSAAGLPPGDARVAVRVTDDFGLSAIAEATIAVVPPANRPPIVTLSGHGWSAGFLASLRSSGLGDGGYVLSGDGGKPTPWANLDQVVATFNHDGVIAASSLRIKGADGQTVATSNFNYFADRRQAVWTLAAPLGVGRFEIDVGTAAFSATVVPGDVDRNGVTAAPDLVRVRNHVGQVAGGAAYDVFADLNGDAAVNAADLVLTRNRIGSTLPPAARLFARSDWSIFRDDDREHTPLPE